MGSGFLRDVALRKQLEEKVKEAAKVRQQAESEVAAARAVIDEARASDANTTEAQTALADAEAAMSTKDYKRAVERAAEAKERGKRAYSDRSRHFLDTTRSLLQTTKSLGVEDRDGFQALQKADEAYAKEAFGEAIDLAKQAWKRSEKVLHEHLSSSFSTAQSLILTAKNIGRDTGTAEDLLSRARSAVEGNDFEPALAFTKECLDAVTAELAGAVDRATQEVQLVLRTSQEFGADPQGIVRLLERAKADVAKGEYDKALNSLRQAKQEGERTLGKGLESRALEFAKGVVDAEQMGADVAPAKKIFSQFEKAFKEGKLAEATEIARQGQQVLQKTQFDRVLLTISASREKFITARNLGADLTLAIEHLNKARSALQSGRFSEAEEFSKQADAAVDQVVREYQGVDNEIRAMQRAFADAEVGGVDTGPAKRHLDRARSLLSQRDLRGAQDLLQRGRDELQRMQSERALEVIEKAEFMVTSGEKMGAKLEEASRTLEEAVTFAKGKNFSKAMELATKSRDHGERAVQKALGDSISGLKGSLSFLGEDASSVRTLLERAESAQSARDFETAYGYLEEAMRLAEGKSKDKALQFHDLLRRAAQFGIELGCDVTGLDAGLKETNSAMDRGRYAEVIGLKDRFAHEIGVVAENAFNAVKGRVVEAKNLNIEIADMRELLKRAKMAIGVEDFDESFNLLRQCNEQANKAVVLHKEVYNAISSAAALVAEAKKRDVNVSKVLEMLLEAKRAHERLDHERALELAQNAKMETEKLMVLYSSAQKIIAARGLLDLVGKAGVDAPHLKQMLEEAKEAMKDKAYDRALETSERGEKAVRELIQERVQSLLSASEGTIESLENLNLLAQEEKIIRAREALNRGDFAQAVELAAAMRDEIEAIKKKSEEVAVSISRAKGVASELEAMNISAPEGLAAISQAEQAARESRFNDAFALVNESVEKMERAREAGIEAMVSRFEESIQRTKRDSVDTRSAEKLIARSREFLKEKKYRQALALAMQAEGEAEKVGLQQDMAAKAIATAEKKLGGLPVSIPDLQRMLAEAKRGFDEADYVRALDVAIKTGEEFNHFRETYEEAQEVARRAERLYHVALAIGADASAIGGLIETAKEAAEAGRAQAARDGFQRALDAGQSAVRGALESSLKEAKNLADAAKRIGADPSEALRKLSEAKAQFDVEDFEGAARFVEEGLQSARDAAHRIVEDAITAAQSNIEHSHKLGAETVKAGEMLARARAHLQSGEVEKALEEALGSRELIRVRMDSERKFADRSFQAESMIRRAKKFGIDAGESERLLAEAIQTKKTDPDRALALADRAQEAAQRAIDSFLPNVTATLALKDPVAGVWADATLTLTNEAKGLAKDVKVKILGDAEVEGLKEVPAIRAKASESLPLRVKMMTAGSIPLAVQITSIRILDGKEYRQEIIVTVEVAQAPPAPAEKIAAAVESRCPACKGLIKIGFAIRRCPHCERDIHELCATRSPNCAACGGALSAEPKRKKISFKVG